MKVKVNKILRENNCKKGDVFSFNAETKTITYVPEDLNKKEGVLALLHELAHLNLGHFTYTYDVELLRLESEAWEKTRELAEYYGISVSEKHITDCITSYDEWISKRATCPKCNNYALQKNMDTFGCFICDTIWKVNQKKTNDIRKKVVNKTKKASAQTNFAAFTLAFILRFFG